MPTAHAVLPGQEGDVLLALARMSVAPAIACAGAIVAAIGRTPYFIGAGAASTNPVTTLMRPSAANVAKSVPPR
jgi:hypothetical protein